MIENRNPSEPNEAVSLIGDVAASRIISVVSEAKGSRVVYAMVDLGREITSAIGLAVNQLRSLGRGSVSIAIHPDLACEWLPKQLISSNAATWFRNHRDDESRVMIFSVSGQHMDEVVQSLGSIHRINHSWLLDAEKADMWAKAMMPAYHGTDVYVEFTKLVTALMQFDMYLSPLMLAKYCIELRDLMNGAEGLALSNAARSAFPSLQLPRDCIAENEWKSLLSKPSVEIPRLRREFGNYLYLRDRRGEIRLRSEMIDKIQRLESEGILSSENSALLRAFANDREIVTGSWRQSQRRVAQVPWPDIRQFFQRSRTYTEPLGEETVRFLDNEHPNSLTQRERETLFGLRGLKSRVTSDVREVYFRHRERIRENRKLYRRWNRLIFDSPIQETDDLLVGLVELIARGMSSTDHVPGAQVTIQLRHSDRLSFWTREKNRDMCCFLRDRYRGIGAVMPPSIHIDFGLCWERDWECEITQTSQNRKGGASCEFVFEAYSGTVSDSTSHTLNAPSYKTALSQLYWSPKPSSFSSAFSVDLRSIVGDGETAHLLRSSSMLARGSSGTKVNRPTLNDVSSIIDSQGGSEGHLVYLGVEEGTADWNRIGETWPRALLRYGKGVLDKVDQAKARELFDRFRTSYSSALCALIRPRGEGLASESLVEQAERFGTLLEWLRRNAVSDVLVREVWAPLLAIGTTTIEDDDPMMIVAPWHPLRLLELAAKAHQASSVIDRLINGPGEDMASVEEYVGDFVRMLRDTYYVDIGVARTPHGPRLLVETERLGGYSLLQPGSGAARRGSDVKLNEMPVHEAVSKFGEIAKHYLELNPHDRANFSVVVLDSESEELPIAVAKHLAQSIQQQQDLRCELTVTHGDIKKLHKLYDRQNQRIGREIDSALTSEAARTFLSRLRIGITERPPVIGPDGDHREHDILLLHDVLAPHAQINWKTVTPLEPSYGPLDHTPNDISRRKSLTAGSLSTSVYLTAPVQPACTQPYLDALHDVVEGKSSGDGAHFVPIQDLELASMQVRSRLDYAHQIARWVVTHDRIADRRVIGREEDRLRVLRYFSSPRSKYTTIVSTEISQDVLRGRLEDDIERILLSDARDERSKVINKIQQRAADFSGGIVMRGSLWDNYARELIGVLVCQREIELLLDSSGEKRRTAMFFLDEINEWMNLKGEMADILAVSLQVQRSGQRVVSLIVAEAKCIGKGELSSAKVKSRRQLDGTYSAMVNRFCNDCKNVGERKLAGERTFWHKRLADLLIEHMRPWATLDRLGGWSFDEWIDCIRQGVVPICVSGHSVISVHDLSEGPPYLDLWIEEQREGDGARRMLAQWTLGSDGIAKSIRGLIDDIPEGLLHIPEEWLQGSEVMGGADLTQPSTVGSSPDSSIQQVEFSKDTDQQLGTSMKALEGVRTVPPRGDSDESDMVAVPEGWKRLVFEAVCSLASDDRVESDTTWLTEQTERFRIALQAEGLSAPVQPMRVTPNAGLVRLDGQNANMSWLVRHQEDCLLVRHGIEIVRISAKPGYIVVAIKRPHRSILHLVDAWQKRQLGESAPVLNLAPVIGENEDDGELFYLPLSGEIGHQERAAPHTLISGTTGSGKGILASNLILDFCAFNDPRHVHLYLIDPKLGADYIWANHLPHLQGGIVHDHDAAISLLEKLAEDMEERYMRIASHRCANIIEFNRKCDPSDRLPYIIILFDEVANWMQDDSFKKRVEKILNSIATKSRAAGLHLIMIYQRADQYVMTMQLRANLGNKLILKLGDQGSSKVALGEKGAEVLMGKGHIIADVGTGERIYGQVPYIEPDEAHRLAEAIQSAWTENSM